MRPGRILSLVLAAGASLAFVLAIRVLRKPKPLAGDDRPANLAHRGDSDGFPENTLAAFEAGISAGAGGLELDVHMTRDGYIVVIHDDTVDRTTDGAGPVREMTLSRLRELDAGYRFAPERGYPFRGRGLYTPTLAEVLEKFPRAFVNLEIKEALPGIEGTVLEVIREAGAWDRVLVAAADHGIMVRFRRLSGGRVLTSASQREIRIFYLLGKLGLETLLRPSYDALQVPVNYGKLRILTPGFLRAARGLGVRVDAWTINDPDEMRRLLELGVDIIMTDRPAELTKVMSE